jgi:hypothetical protein
MKTLDQQIEELKQAVFVHTGILPHRPTKEQWKEWSREYNRLSKALQDLSDQRPRNKARLLEEQEAEDDEA